VDVPTQAPSTSPSPAPSPSPSATPSDPLGEAWSGECFFPDDGEQDLTQNPSSAWQSTSCSDGEFKVIEVLANTPGTSGCNGFTGDDWNVPDQSSDRVVCFTYLDSNSAYNAAVNNCVYGLSYQGAPWSAASCSAGHFTVVSKHWSTTSTDACGSNIAESFTVSDYPVLDEVLCVQMLYPTLGSVPLNTCLRESGPVRSPTFTSSSCADANVVIRGRVFVYDDPSFCGQYSSAWWYPAGYPNLGFTACLGPN
jgi:hypothetical protein